MQQTDSSRANSPVPDQTRLLLYLPVTFAVGLHLVGAFFPGYRTWGIDIWSILPTWAVVALPAFYLLVSIPAASIAIFTAASLISNGLRRTLAGLPTFLTALVVSLCVFAVFFFFRSRALVYGDGFLILDRITFPLTAPFTDLHEFTKPLNTYLYRFGYLALSSFGLTKYLAVGLISSLCGVLGFWGLVRLVKRLSPSSPAQYILLSGAASCACTVLFFGYVEQYTLSTALLLWWIAALVAYYRGESGLWQLIAMTALLILSNILLLPVAIFLFVRPRSASSEAQLLLLYAFGLRNLHILLLALAGSISIAAIVQLARVPIALVPIVAKSDNQYWFLSLDHFSDMVNLVLHVAPVGLLALIISRKGGLKHLPVEGSLLLMVSLALLITSFWFDPVLGAARDWDLLSSFGFPLTLAGLLALVTSAKEPRQMRLLAVQCALAVLLLFVPNLIEKNSLEAASLRLDRIVWNSPHYQTSYHDGYDIVSWGATLSNKMSRPDLAEKYYARRLQAVPTDSRCWFDLGAQRYNRAQYDSAAYFLGRAWQLDPATDYRVVYALALQALGRHDEVKPLVENIDLRTLDDSKLLGPLGILLFKEGFTADALVAFRWALRLEPNGFDEHANLGLCFAGARQSDSAVYYFEGAKPFCPPAKRCDLLQAIVAQRVKLPDLKASEAALNEYAEACPKAPDLSVYRRAIAEALQRTQR